NWNSISNAWRTPPHGPGGGGDGSNGGSGAGPITTTGFTGKVGPIITLPGRGTILPTGTGSSGTSLEEMGRPGQRPRLPYGEGGYERVPHNKAKGASPSWVVRCGFSLVAGNTLGGMVYADTSG